MDKGVPESCWQRTCCGTCRLLVFGWLLLRPTNSKYALLLFQDTTFEFERKRDVPVKYDRELWQRTRKLWLGVSICLSVCVYVHAWAGVFFCACL